MSLLSKDFVGEGAGDQPSARQTIVSDWNYTLSLAGLRMNDDLLDFLWSARRAGHRVVVTSSGDLESVKEVLFLHGMKSKRAYDAEFDFIPKANLRAELNAPGQAVPYLVFDDAPRIDYVAAMFHEQVSSSGRLSASVAVHRDVLGIGKGAAAPSVPPVPPALGG